MLQEAEQIMTIGAFKAALVLAWAGLEASMRRLGQRLGVGGKTGTQPLTVVRELYAIGKLSPADFKWVEETRIIRTQIVHGHPAPIIGNDTVLLIVEIAKRFLSESETARTMSE
jgi:hypothetical protein